MNTTIDTVLSKFSLMTNEEFSAKLEKFRDSDIAIWMRDLCEFEQWMQPVKPYPNSVIESLRKIKEQYKGSPSHTVYYLLPTGERVISFVVKTKFGSDCFNYHPLRKGMSKTHSVNRYDPVNQCFDTIESLKRLFEKPQD